MLVKSANSFHIACVFFLHVHSHLLSEAHALSGSHRLSVHHVPQAQDAGRPAGDALRVGAWAFLKADGASGHR